MLHGPAPASSLPNRYSTRCRSNLPTAALLSATASVRAFDLFQRSVVSASAVMSLFLLSRSCVFDLRRSRRGCGHTNGETAPRTISECRHRSKVKSQSKDLILPTYAQTTTPSLSLGPKAILLAQGPDLLSPIDNYERQGNQALDPRAKNLLKTAYAVRFIPMCRQRTFRS